jgi:hypothetical protein
MQDLGGRFVLANESEQLMHLGKVLNEDDDAEEVRVWHTPCYY